MPKPIRLTIIIVCSLLTACSSTSFIYDNAPWLIRGRVDDYFSLNNLQEQQIEEHIENLFLWHRHEELSEYVNALADFNLVFADGLTHEEYARASQQITNAQLRITSAILEPAVDFLLSVSAEQMVYYDSEFQQRIAKDREALDLSEAERFDIRYERWLDNLQDWFGSFDTQQQRRLRDIIQTRPDTRRQWLDYRETRHQEFMTLMRQQPGRAAIRKYFQQRFGTLDASQQGFRWQWQQRLELTLLSIDKMLTDEQRQRAISRLEGYRNDFINLSKK